MHQPAAVLSGVGVLVVAGCVSAACRWWWCINLLRCGMWCHVAGCERRCVTQIAWNVICNGGPFEHDSRMNWSSRTRLFAEVTFRALETHFVWKNTTFRAPAIYQHFTKCCTCHCHEKWHSNTTKYCACHGKWDVMWHGWCEMWVLWWYVMWDVSDVRVMWEWCVMWWDMVVLKVRNLEVSQLNFLWLDTANVHANNASEAYSRGI